jgi:CheY-like chemotaxis protein
MRKILLVDDEPNLLEAIWRMIQIEESEWEVSFALSVDEALDKTSQINFDVIVSDVKMPVKSGLDLVRILRKGEATKDIPVLILTGSTESELRQQAMDLGASQVINKPFTVDKLVQELRNVMK